MMASNNKQISAVGNYFAYLWQHRPVYKMMVQNEFKGRFKNTILGYFWHLINPLTHILIYLIIFTMIFGRGIPNYWLYVSTGMFAFSFFISCTTGGANCMVSNSNLITKMSMCREVIVFAKVTSNLITMLISYLLIIILMILVGVKITENIVLLPIVVAFFTIFVCGLTLGLSAITVFIRDVPNAIGLLFGCMMFAIPIMYLPGTRSTPAMELFWSINPLYYYVEVLHDVFYWGVCPDLFQFGMCIVFAIVSLLVGWIIFKKSEMRFAERL